MFTLYIQLQVEPYNLCDHSLGPRRSNMGPVNWGEGTQFCPFCSNRESMPESPPAPENLAEGGGGGWTRTPFFLAGAP